MKKVKFLSIENADNLNLNVVRATQIIPDWYKKSPQRVEGLEKLSLNPNNPSMTTSTYKICSPFLDALTNGYMFYLSEDIEVAKHENGEPYILYRKASGLETVSAHDDNQWTGLHYPENCYPVVFKWQNHFVTKTPKKYSTLITHPHNRFDLPFYTLSGVVDTDKYNLEIQFPFFIKNNFTGIIKAGTPIAQITFFKRHTWFKTLDRKKQNFVKQARFKFFSNIERSYKNLIWQKKEYL